MKGNAEEIFNHAVELKDPAEQAKYLDEICAGDEKLRAEVEALLQWNQEAGSFLEAPHTDPNATLETSIVPEASGTVIGRYKLLEKIGEGGMATVYMAEQKHPIRRRVALKIIKLGMNTKQVIARFEAERQALAMMDHPNIAKVLDAGTTDTGRPYFVMELVRGLPITEFCDKNSLTTRERLDLFIFACQAVQHAHQRGIIHRDIKPSNILVTLHDGQPVCKVIDFGIAKAVNQQLTEKTVFTRFSQMIGTPEYMSPEQAEMSGLDIDTRTDVFSLGVLLYELLTSTTPFDSEYLLSKGYGEMQRIIREEEPIRPSTKISTLGEALTDVAKHRRTSPELLCKLIRTDLDWIVMKTMEKDRNRRYESVSELAADVQRHLDYEPVLAGRPSTVYRVQKFVKRNKTLCVSFVTVAAILIIAVIISSHQAWVAQQAKGVAEAERDRAQMAKMQALEEQDRAESNLYDSLLKEARAVRLARGTGYRNEVFEALERACELNVPQKKLADLRSEAIACMGDFAGLKPTSVMELPEGPGTPAIWRAVRHPKDPIAAFGLLDGTVILRDLRSARDIARFEYGDFCSSVCFASTGKALLSVHMARGDSLWDLRFEGAVAHLFVCAEDGTWIQSRSIPLPYAAYGMPLGSGFAVAVIDTPSSPARLVEPLTGKVFHEFGFHVDMNSIPVIEVSTDGRMMALSNVESTSSDMPILDVWDLVRGEHLKRLEPNLSMCTCLKFSIDRRYLAFLSTSGAYIYSTETWEVVGHIAEPFRQWADVAFLPQGNEFIFSLGSRFSLWDFETKEYLATFEQPLGGVARFSVSADGRSLMTYDGKRAWLYSLDTADEMLVLSGHTGGVPGIAFSPDGSHLASVSKDRKIRVWNSVTGDLAWEQGLRGLGQGISYSADGRYLLTTDYDRDCVCIWSTDTSELLGKVGSEEKDSIWKAELTGDNRYLVVAAAHLESDNGGLRIWRCSTDDSGALEMPFKPRHLKSFSGSVGDFALTPNGSRIAFVGYSAWDAPRELYQWDLSGIDAPRLLTEGVVGAAQIVDFARDGRRIVVVDTDRSVVSYDAQSGDRMASFATLKTEDTVKWDPILMHKLSPDGMKMAMASPSMFGVDLWDYENGTLLYSLPEQEGTTYYFAWSPDGRRLAVSWSNGDVHIWNLAEIERVLTELRLYPSIGDGTEGRTQDSK